MRNEQKEYLLSLMLVRITYVRVPQMFIEKPPEALGLILNDGSLNKFNLNIMTNWVDTLRVVKTLIEDEYDLSDLTINDHYRIEKLTDAVFTAVRKRELLE